MQQIFKKLNKVFNEYDNFIIMGHKDPDLDSLGSSMGLAKILKKKGKKAYVFLNNSIKKYNLNIRQSLEKINKKQDFVNSKTYKDMKGKTLLVIVDVNVVDRLEYPKILDEYDKLVIDHHIKSKNYIKDTIFTYVDSNLSSISELISYYANYLNIDLHTIISTILLGGIEIDTNSFNIKTTRKTYEAASILMDMGADPILKQELLKETKEDYVKRANNLKTSFMINKNMAMCIINHECSSMDLATLAEELLNFEDVEASFTIGKLDAKTVGVSARSLGKINVEKIMQKLGGGGHKSNAATQIKDKKLQEVKQEIIDIVGDL